MTTPDTLIETPAPVPGRVRLPVPPEREPDDMTRFDRLTENGNVHHLGKPPDFVLEVAS